MHVQPFSGTERADLLRRYTEALNAYNALMDAEAFDEARASHAEAERLQALYFDRLPRLPVSCCPYDGKPLYRTFDPYGLDGPWWRPDATPEEAPACPHFCVLRGAVHYQGRSPQAGDFEVHPGPEVPYVIPRLLEMDGMIAVIAQLEMENGFLAYTITYFAERRPPPQDLTAGWARTVHAYTTQLGEAGWSVPNDVWDFDLQPWLEKGKIRWCPPGSDNTFLSTDPPDQCPYVNLPGTRQRIVVEGDQAATRGLPTGEPLWPQEW